MTQALSIGVTSLDANRVAIDATSENVANVQTPGYVRESAQLDALPGGGLLGVGDGVEVTTVAQATSALLSANNWQAQGAMANLGSLQQTLTAIENVFPLATQPASASSGGTAATSSASISGQLATFWSSWDAIAQYPASSAPRTQVVDEAQSLAVSFHEAATQLSQIAANSQKQLTEQVSQVDTLLTQAASLNQSIITTKGSAGNPNQLEDQLRSVIGTLSQLAGVEVRTQGDGTAMVSIGGVTVVQGDQASSLTVTSSSGETSVVAAPGGVAVPVGSGSIAGLLASVNTSVPKYQSKLDGVADALATVVNGQLASGYTATGASGTPYPLFVGTGAAGLGVNAALVADPSLIAASSTGTPAAAANNGGNAQTMAELGTLPYTAATKTGGPDAAYQTMVQDIGSDTQSVDNQLQAQTSVATQAQQALQAVTGVNVDDELTNLLGYQQDYEASAKLLSTVDTTIQSLLQAV
ncbi:MAG: flagellar hook-associated protein FlgK [Acidimicrobiales bacterium]